MHTPKALENPSPDRDKLWNELESLLQNAYQDFEVDVLQLFIFILMHSVKDVRETLDHIRRERLYEADHPLTKTDRDLLGFVEVLTDQMKGIEK